MVQSERVQLNLHSITEFIQCLSWWDDRKWENNVHKLQKENHSLNLDTVFRRENIHLVFYYLGFYPLASIFLKFARFWSVKIWTVVLMGTFFALSRCNNQKCDSVMVFPVLVCWAQKFRWMRSFIFIQLLKFVSGHIVMQKDSSLLSRVLTHRQTQTSVEFINLPCTSFRFKQLNSFLKWNWHRQRISLTHLAADGARGALSRAIPLAARAWARILIWKMCAPGKESYSTRAAMGSRTAFPKPRIPWKSTDLWILSQDILC